MLYVQKESHCDDCDSDHDRGRVRPLRNVRRSRGSVAPVRSTRAMGHVDVVRSESTVTVLVVVYRILHVPAIPYYPNTPVD